MCLDIPHWGSSVKMEKHEGGVTDVTDTESVKESQNKGYVLADN